MLALFRLRHACQSVFRGPRISARVRPFRSIGDYVITVTDDPKGRGNLIPRKTAVPEPPEARIRSSFLCVVRAGRESSR